MTVSWSINTLAVAKLVPLRPGLQRCDEQEEHPGDRPKKPKPPLPPRLPNAQSRQ